MTVKLLELAINVHRILAEPLSAQTAPEPDDQANPIEKQPSALSVALLIVELIIHPRRAQYQIVKVVLGRPLRLVRLRSDAVEGGSFAVEGWLIVSRQ